MGDAARILGAEAAIAAFRRGEMLILVDDEDRENEGDLVMAADFIDPDAINFMARHGRGLICVAITPERAADLELGPMVARNTALLETAFTVSVDSRHHNTTGISAFDRAATIRVLIDPETRPDDLSRPGHMFPLVARSGGVLERPGHTEAVVELARRGGLFPAGVLCEVLAEDGTMARLPELIRLAEAHGLGIARIADLVAWCEIADSGGPRRAAVGE